MVEMMVDDMKEFEKEYPYNLLTHYLIEGNKITPDTPYEIEEIDAKELLTPERIDLMAKWIYIDAKEKGVDMTGARDIYAKHIEAFSEGTFTEPGTEEKNTLDKYYDTFDKLIEDIRENGFDSQKSLVPVGKDNVLLDGAHRCVCAAYFGKKVKVIRFESIMKDYGTEFFKRRFLEEDVLDQLVVNYCKVKNNLFCACLWPAAEAALSDDAEKIIQEECGKIIYSKSLKLSYHALRNFMIQIYGHQSWTGTVENKHQGVDSKVEACFANRETRVIFFHCESLERVLTAKEHIRELFKIENHSVHISDTDEETRMMAGILLNKNSRHFLEYGDIDFSRELNCVLQQKRKTGSLDNVIMAPEATLAAYGIKETGEEEAYVEEEGIIDVLCNPQSFFEVYGVKFLSLSEVKRMNECGKVQGSKEEIREINKLLRKMNNAHVKPQKKRKANQENLLQNIKDKIVFITQKLHVYEGMLKVYHLFKK